MCQIYIYFNHAAVAGSQPKELRHLLQQNEFEQTCSICKVKSVTHLMHKYFIRAAAVKKMKYVDFVQSLHLDLPSTL